MANAKLETLLKKSIDEWNEWRSKNPTVIPDLEEADLKELDSTKASLRFNIQSSKSNRNEIKKAESPERSFPLLPKTTVKKLSSVNLMNSNLKGANFEGANLTNVNLKGANLSGAILKGVKLKEAILTNANLEGADLSGAKLEGANLQGANFTETNLERADLNNANLENAKFEGAKFEGAKFGGVNFTGANLRGVDFGGRYLVDSCFAGADLRGINLAKANLHGADLSGSSLEGANLEEANLELAKLEGVKLEGVKLIRAKLKQVNLEHVDFKKFDLREVEFDGANLEGANLSESDMREAVLVEANLKEANLTNSNLEMANFNAAKITEAKLKGANLFKIKLRCVDFTKMDLGELDFTGANLELANFTEANLERVNFTGADLKDTRFVNAQLYGANFSSTFNINEEAIMKAQYFGANFNEHIHDLPTIKTIYKKNHDECSKDIRRIGLVLLSYSVFCLLTLGQPGAKILVDNTVTIPFADVPIDFNNFMIFGPLGLIMISAYFHVFIRERLKYDDLPHIEKLPFAFNLKNPFAILLSDFVFYFLTPVIFFLFAVKARVLPWIGTITYSFSIIVAQFSMVSFAADYFKKERSVGRSTVWQVKYLLWVIILFLIGGILSVTYLRSGELVLEDNADLAGRHFIEWNLNELSAKGASLMGADLRGADLRGANLKQADLRKADLNGASLQGSRFPGADFRGATLNEANLQGYSSIWTNLFQAKIITDILKVIRFSQDHEGADLRGVKNLTLEQLQSAIVDENTKLPPQFKVVKTSDSKWTVEEVKAESSSSSSEIQGSSLRSE